MSIPARLAVFASGGGTNLQALLDHFHGPSAAAARVELVVGSREGIGAIARAEAAGVAAAVVDARAIGEEAAADALLALLVEHRIDAIALAGYLRLIPGSVVERFRGRILNIHPALLPAFGGPGMYGMRVHRAVLESGATVSGATVHLVDEKYDEGRIILQWPVPVLPGDTAERLAARVLRVEHIIYPLAVEAMARGAELRPPAGELSFDIIDAGTPAPSGARRLLAHAF